MAFDVTKIHVGAARIWTGATAAASGNPPTYATHASGVPNQGAPVEIGLTDVDCTFTYTLKKTEILAEQVTAPVDVFGELETCMLVFTMQESNANALKIAIDPSVGYDSTGGDAFYFGGGSSVIASATTCVFFSSPRRDSPTKFFTGQLYKAYSKDGLIFPMSRTKKGMVKVTLIALADITRTSKDFMGYIRREA